MNFEDLMEKKKVMDIRGNKITAYISDKNSEKQAQFFSSFFYSTDDLTVIKNDRPRRKVFTVKADGIKYYIAVYQQ